MLLSRGYFVDFSLLELVLFVFVAVGLWSVLDCRHLLPAVFECAEGGESEDCGLERGEGRG